MLINFLIFFLFLAPISASLAQTTKYDSLFGLTLKELLDIRVTVASTQSETVIETPAIVSRYNRIDLEQMGITTLREMFNFIPGIIVQDGLPGFASVQIRGIDETFNQKVLFLLDGVPYHQPSHSIIPMEGIPWEAISHVEVIRGPGAVFYGSQASAGVLNVITRSDTEDNSAYFKVGDNSLYEGSAYYNQKLTEQSTMVIAAENRSEDAHSTSYEEDFPGVGIVTDNVDRYLERTSGLIRYNHQSLILQLQAFTDSTVGINDAVSSAGDLQPFILDTSGELIHIENTWSTSNSQTTIFSDYNHYTISLRIKNFFDTGVDALATKDDDGKDDYRFRFGSRFDYTITESLDLVMGAEQETRSTSAYRFYFYDNQSTPLATLLEKGSVDEFSAYTQLDYRHNKWRFLIGGRFTHNERSGKKTTPRAAALYNIDPYQSIKALYSTGFNSPNATQTSINPTNDAATLVGNDGLTAEVVKTTDLAYSYSKSNVLFVANIYYLEAEDFIVRRFSNSEGRVSFFNEGIFTRKGVELDFQMANRESKVFANLAYQKEGNQNDLDDPAAFNTPRLTFTLGANSSIWNTHNIGGNISYIGARHNLNAYSIVNVNYTARLTNFDVFAVVRNIFDEDILNPDNTTQSSGLVAHGEQGTNFQLGIRLHF